jgi:PPOX class probable F420-dependent enzyme
MLQDRGMLSAVELGFVARARVGYLATADAHGVPHVVPVCFVVAEDTLYITVDQKPKGDPRALKRLRNLVENPAAAVVVDRWDEDWTRLGWIMLRGAGEILDGGAEHDRAQALLRARYPQYRPMRLADLPVIAVRIERVASWGNLTIEDG